ncbi:ParB/RepB/Spo0J family partition protein [Azotobacter beijerinckii]|nr:ParB/RepB/Spo0J family partition protein [Azotobacter beijerinckii]
MAKHSSGFGKGTESLTNFHGIRKPDAVPKGSGGISVDTLLEQVMDESSSGMAERADETIPATPLKDIPVDLIDKSPYQPRLQLLVESLEELVESIQTIGLLRPILVRPRDGRYELVGGERRWRAHKLINAKTIQALVREMSDTEAEVAALADNEGQEQLTDYERGKGFHGILERKVEPSQRALARRVGVAVSVINRCLAFMDLPKSTREVLDQKPGLIGIRNVKEFVELGGQHQDLVTEAVIQMRDVGIAQEVALRWIRKQIALKNGISQPSQPIKKTLPGVGTLKVSDRAIEVKCDKGVDGNTLAALFEEFLNQVPTEKFKIKN